MQTSSDVCLTRSILTIRLAAGIVNRAAIWEGNDEKRSSIFLKPHLHRKNNSSTGPRDGRCGKRLIAKMILIKFSCSVALVIGPAETGKAAADPALTGNCDLHYHSFVQCSGPSAVLDERAVLQFVECLLQLVLSVHDDRPVPCDRLFNRLAGNQQKANPFRPRLHHDFVSAVEQH